MLEFIRNNVGGLLGILIIGALFLIAGSLRHEPLFRATGVPKPAH